MPVNDLEQVIFNLGAQLGEQLIAGFHAAVSKRGSVSANQGPVALSRAHSPKTCVVPGCGSASKSTGLCGKHYQKARRNRFDGNHLTEDQLETLAQDGRALRFSKAGSKSKSAAKVARAGKSASRRGRSKGTCIVPGCTGTQASSQLCPRHYQKSRRSGFAGKELSAEQLRFLAKDGRALRFAKSGGESAKGSKKAKRPLAARRSRSKSRKS